MGQVPCCATGIWAQATRSAEDAIRYNTMEETTYRSCLEKHRKCIDDIARRACALHDSVGMTYGGKHPYGYHLSMVAERAMRYGGEVLGSEHDLLPLVFGAYFHDSIEDARLTYNDVRKLAAGYMDGEAALLAAEIVYALTNDKGRTRAERAGEKYYAGIRATPYAPFVKLCDRLANMTYSFNNSDASNLHMREVYRGEWAHFITAIRVECDDFRFALPAAALAEADRLMNLPELNCKTKTMLHFDSDYMEGAHPEVMARLMATNMEQTVGYGKDEYTRHAKELIRQAAGCPDAEVHFLVGGTQTNATVIDGLLARHEGVIAADTAHINVHESGAIEAAGHKVLVLPGHDGKLSAGEVDGYVTRFYADDTYEHMVAPGMVYISFPTETGTLYTRSELEDLSAVCRKHRIPLYIDGARLAYGLASPAAELDLKDIARLADVFYIGGTKVGLLFGEAVVVTRPKELLPHFFPLVKQHGALLAKGRLLGLQFEALFTDDLYGRMGKHAIRLAMKLRQGFIEKGYRLYADSPTNQQFFVLPNKVIDELLASVATFEYWGPRQDKESPVRFVTCWATREEAVDELLARLPVQK